MFLDTNESGIGVIVRDGAGEVIGVLCEKVAQALGAAEMEALAVRRALKFACEIGISDIEFEGDALTIISAMNDQRDLFCLLVTSSMRPRS